MMGALDPSNQAGNGNRKIAILGSGTWGSTLGWLYADAGKTVSLWTRSREKAERMNAERRVDRPLPVAFPPSLAITDNLQECLSDAAVVVFCCTSQSMREVAALASPYIGELRAAAGPDAESLPILVSAAKGLELTTHQRMSEVIAAEIADTPVCALSGPNLAVEILARRPTASVIASAGLDIAGWVQKQLSVPNFRLYSNADLVGVELGGTLKNIIAIAAGSSDGLNLGVNAKAALVTRGLAEMTRLAVAFGAKPLTMSGLAGMGDLIATCNSADSRNYRLGYEMARGLEPDAAIASIGATAEGVTTAEAVCELSIRLGIQLPIAEQVNATLKGKTTPEGAIMTLMARPLSSE